MTNCVGCIKKCKDKSVCKLQKNKLIRFINKKRTKREVVNFCEQNNIDIKMIENIIEIQTIYTEKQLSIVGYKPQTCDKSKVDELIEIGKKMREKKMREKKIINNQKSLF